MATSETLRTITRRAVQGELIAVAERLFDERGYEATSVEEIAQSAGMSRRSFFRYFASKEELVLGKYDLVGERLLENFRTAPASEPLWDALRDMFTQVAPEANTGIPAHAIERIIAETPSLRAGYLYRLDVMQRAIATEARERATRTGTSYAEDDPSPEAMVGAAFACLIAARTVGTGSDIPWKDSVEAAMRAVRPFD